MSIKKFCRAKFNRRNIILAVFSMFLSFSGLFTILLFNPSLSKDTVKGLGLGIQIFTIQNLTVFVLLHVFFFILLRCIDRNICKVRICETDSRDTDKMYFGKVFIMLMLSWGVWFCLYFPGAGMNDTIADIVTFHNGIQPLVYQLLIYYGINGLTKLTHNMTVSYAILTVVQMVTMALVVSWVAGWFKKKGIAHAVVDILIAYYAFMPAVADYSITLVKDTVYGICMMAVVPLIYDLICSNGERLKDKKFYCAVLVSMTGISVLRSNGKYIVLITVVLLLLLKLRNKKYLLSVLGVLLAVNVGVNIGEKNIIEGDYAFKESVGVPMAQIGAVLIEGGYISEQDRQVLNNLLPLDTWKECYRFSFSDPVKFQPDFNNQWLNDHKKEFIGVWFSILKDNVGIYVKAYLCHTYGFWNISPLNITSIDYTQSFFTKINNNTGDDSWCAQFCIENNLRNREILPGTVGEQINTIFQSLFRINLVLGAGIMFWICSGLMIELLIHQKYKICSIFVPAMLNWATMMIASPASFIYRYSFYLVLLLPILFLTTLLQIENRNEQIQGVVCQCPKNDK